jgi:diguanylate cyclase (GGDEF)-like protein/PAS domain S-box-containing protein
LYSVFAKQIARLTRASRAAGRTSFRKDVASLKQREESFRLLFEGNPIPMWVYDRESLCFLAVNEAAVEQHGYSREQFLSKTLLDVRPPEERHVVQQFVREVKKAYGAERVWRLYRADGTEFQAISYGRTLFYEGRPAVLTAIIDVTERIRNEQRIREQNEALSRQEEQLRIQNVRFLTALAYMNQGLCLFDADQRLVISNKRYADLYGLTAEQTRPGTTLRSILEARIAAGASPDDAEEYIEKRLKEVTGGASYNINQLRDGRTIAVLHQPIEGGGWVATHEDITERREAEAQIAHMAHHDALTGLPNRILLRQRMEEALRQTRRNEKTAILCLDLDHFKRVNDTLGHPVGDALLCAVAERLKRCVRESDTVTRLGGDEFAIIQVDSGLKQAANLAQRVVESITKTFEIEGHQVLLGTSIGIVLASHDQSDPDLLLKNADLALYKAKADGRGTFRFFEREMDAEAQQRRVLEMDLRSALQKGDFEVLYQPVVATDTRELAGFEALVRWRHPDKGLVPPASFIPVAEDTGLVVPLGEWVLREACAEAAAWGGDTKLAVNISPVQFRSKNLLQAVVSALASSGLPPSRLELEITESVMLQDSESTLATLTKLRELGVGIAMDDFGTGYSSLSYIHRFPLTKIKIDRSFINIIGQKKGGSAVIRAVVEIARNLRMTIVAEGIETEQQVAKLQEFGCHQMQGFLISQPVAAHEVQAILRRKRLNAAA